MQYKILTAESNSLSAVSSLAVILVLLIGLLILLIVLLAVLLIGLLILVLILIHNSFLQKVITELPHQYHVQFFRIYPLL